MSWGRLDDTMDDDPRWWGLPLASVGLYWATLPYCLRHDENLIPAGLLLRICHPAQEDPKATPLLEAGLWVEVEGGFSYDPDDWTAIHMPEEKRRELSERRAEAGRLGGVASGRSRQTRSNAEATTQQTNPVPVPVPVPRVAKATTPKPPSGAVSQVFAVWVTSTGHTACKLDDKRKRVISARLADYPLEDVLDAVQGWERDPWEGRRQHNEVAILLRDAAHLEKFRDLWRQPTLVAAVNGYSGDYTGPTELAKKYW